MYLRILKYLNFSLYVKKIGVNFGQACSFIGRHINFGSEPYLITLGNHVKISNEVQFITHDGGTFVFREEEMYENVIKFGKIEIGDNCFIGAKSIIMPGVKIGKNCVIAAGSVVTKSIQNNCVVGGNPAKFICSIEEYKNNCKKNNIEYDIHNFKNNKKQELIRISDKLQIKEYIEND